MIEFHCFYKKRHKIAYRRTKSIQNDPNILNDLIKINNDPIARYKLAIDLANQQGEGAREAVFRQRNVNHQLYFLA